MSKESLKHERLLELVEYDPETGVFTNKVERGAARIGQRLGTVDKKGYLTMTIDGYRYYAHRLAWFYVHKQWPKDQIDHIDLDKQNNRIANLRETDNRLNQANIPVYGKHGIKGVCETNGRFWSKITVKGKPIYLGCFATAAEAGAAYERASLKYHGKHSVFAKERGAA